MKSTPLLDYYSALTQLLDAAQTQRTTIELVPTVAGVGRCLAHTITAQYDAPLFTNSAMDGYALCVNLEQPSYEYTIVGRISAGDDGAVQILNSNQAMRIFTGAPIPQGVNAVVAQELTEVNGDTVSTQTVLKKGMNIRIQGEDYKKGAELIALSTRLNPAHIGLATQQGYAQLPLHTRLKVTVFSSGKEVLEPTEVLRAGAIYDANRYQLIAWFQQLHCDVSDGGILPDDLAQTKERLAHASTHSDLIITSGGASVGEEDHLKNALMQLGELTQWKLSIKPGKPFAWGRIQNAQVMMLPGNPVATFVTFKMLVEPVIRVRMGASAEQARPQAQYARANFNLNKPDSRREFLRGYYWCDAQGLAHVDKLDNQGSHMLSACGQANCFIEIAAELMVKKNDLIPFYPL